MIKNKIATAIATGALLLNAFTPLAFADTTIQITGNGSSSNNTANVTMNHSTLVTQNNVANVTNNVDADANTGGNDANDNTGGDVTIDTGNATSNVDVSNSLNRNHADVQNCDCDGGNTTVEISENGSNSDNEATLNTSSTTDVYQDNLANVYNYVDADARTGNNDANRNTGGDVLVRTGHARADVEVSTHANANVASVGGDGNGAGKTKLLIWGNGSNSDNSIDLTRDRSILLVQNNIADVYNYVDADARTGRNDANDNTGGDVTIDTGNALARVDVDNELNFNVAEVSCGCDMDLLAKVAGNGTDSDNDITASLSDLLDVYQDNFGALDNDVDADAKTGRNRANRNTGPAGDDPTVFTGHALDDVHVSNNANTNVFGPGADLELPEGFHFDFSFDLSDLLALIGSLHLG